MRGPPLPAMTTDPSSLLSLDPARRAELVARAREVAERAYAPASGFAVGAALLGDDGRIHVGCNVENASYGLTICAERGAVCSAVAAGSRRFVAVAVWTRNLPPSSPCGACRQVLAEFTAPDCPVLLAGGVEALEVVETDLAALLPRPFTPRELDDHRGDRR